MKESCSFLLLSTGRKEIERAKNEKEKKKKKNLCQWLRLLDGWMVKK
jgi:hypothetical protein